MIAKQHLLPFVRNQFFEKTSIIYYSITLLVNLSNVYSHISGVVVLSLKAEVAGFGEWVLSEEPLEKPFYDTARITTI